MRLSYCSPTLTLLTSRRKSKKPPPFAKQGSVVDCLIETSAPICIERFEDYKQLGRFTLRDEGQSCATSLSRD